MKHLLTRDQFKLLVFKRDYSRCVVCKSIAVDAHHLIERKLFSDGGYYLDNGVSLCEDHHMDAESTKISVESLRLLANIKNIVLPTEFDINKIYDKWGNIIDGDRIIPGPLFHDRGYQKIVKNKK